MMGRTKTRTKSWVWTAALGLLLVWQPSLARAQDDETPSIEQARSAFLRGRAAMGQDEWQRAEQEFSYAARAKNTPGLSYYIAYCLEQQGRLVEALAQYRNTELMLESEPTPDVEQLIGPALARVKEAIPHIVLQGVPARATVALDGEPRGRRESMFVDPGNHDLLIEAPGYRPFRAAFWAKKNQNTLITVDMTPLEPEPALERSVEPTVELPPSSSAEKQALFWSSVGLGAVGVATGLVGTGLWIDASSRAKSAALDVGELGGNDEFPCADPVSSSLVEPCDELDSWSRRRSVGRLVTIVGFGAGAVGILGAIFTQALWKRPQTSSSTEPHTEAARRRMTLIAAPLHKGAFWGIRTLF